MTQPTRDFVVQCIARHQSRLRGLIRCLLLRAGDVDDLLQEVNVVLWEKADEFQPGTDFWAWASQIARFKVLNQLRTYRREKLVFSDAAMERIAELAEQKLQTVEVRREALDDCLKQLPPAQRQLLDLRYAGSHSIDKISETIGRPSGSIRQALYRVRAALQACIESKLALEVKST